MMISIEGLSKTYDGDVKALKKIDLTIGQGLFGLLGPNGAGKTTLMRILVIVKSDLRRFAARLLLYFPALEKEFMNNAILETTV